MHARAHACMNPRRRLSQLAPQPSLEAVTGTDAALATAIGAAGDGVAAARIGAAAGGKSLAGGVLAAAAAAASAAVNA